MTPIPRILAVMALICGLSGFCLSYLKTSTASAIEEQVLTFVQGPAILSVLSGTDNSPIAERKRFEVDGKSVMVFPGKKDGKLVSVALENSAKGFGGDIGVMVGFNLENDTLSGIGITTMKETPGLGTRIAEPAFTKQFVGKPLSNKLKSQGGSIDAVSGATISSTGAVEAVNKASRVYSSLKSSILESWK